MASDRTVNHAIGEFSQITSTIRGSPLQMVPAPLLVIELLSRTPLVRRVIQMVLYARRPLRVGVPKRELVCLVYFGDAVELLLLGWPGLVVLLLFGG